MLQLTEQPDQLCSIERYADEQASPLAAVRPGMIPSCDCGTGRDFAVLDDGDDGDVGDLAPGAYFGGIGSCLQLS